MKRISLLGLALLAVLAMGAFAASSTMAEVPAILPLPSAAEPLNFTSESTTALTLETTKGGEKGTLSCAKAKGIGSFTSANKGSGTVDLKGCKQGTKNCTSKGEAAGTILVVGGVLQLVDVLVAGVLDLGVLALLPSGGVAFECGTLKDEVKGAAIGVVDNAAGELLKDLEKSKRLTGSSKSIKGEQEVTECMFPEAVCKGAKFKPEAELGLGVELAAGSGAGSVTFEKEAEVHF